MTHLVITSRQIRAILPFASQDGTRLHMNGILVSERSSGLLVATDGHTLIEVPVGCLDISGASARSTVTAPVFLRSAFLKACADAAGARGEVCVDRRGPEDIVAQAFPAKPKKGPAPVLPPAILASAFGDTIDPRSFPPWEQVVPQVVPHGTKVERFTISPEYFGRLDAVRQACCASPSVSGATLECGEDEGATLWSLPGGIRCVIMTMRRRK